MKDDGVIVMNWEWSWRRWTIAVLIWRKKLVTLFRIPGLGWEYN